MFLTEWNRVIERHPDTKKVRFLIDGKIVTPESHGYEDGLLTIQLTEPTVWDGNHPRQAEWDALWDKHVPASGEADTPYGEGHPWLGSPSARVLQQRVLQRLARRVWSHDFYLHGFIDRHPSHSGIDMNGFRKWMRSQRYGSCDFDIHAARQFNAITEYILDYDKHNH